MSQYLMNVNGQAGEQPLSGEGVGHALAYLPSSGCVIQSGVPKWGTQARSGQGLCLPCTTGLMGRAS